MGVYVVSNPLFYGQYGYNILIFSIIVFLYMCDFTVGCNSRSGIARSKGDFLNRNVISTN